MDKIKNELMSLFLAFKGDYKRNKQEFICASIAIAFFVLISILVFFV